MISKKLAWAFLAVFLLLSFTTFISNMPEKKNKRVYETILPYFPFKIIKELGGIDIMDKRTGKDLDIDNAQVYLAFDAMLKKWGKKHLILDGYDLYILDDQGKKIAKIHLKSQEEVDWIKKFFFSP